MGNVTFPLEQRSTVTFNGWCERSLVMQPLMMCLVLTGIHGLFVMAEYAIVKTANSGRGDNTSPRFSEDLSHIHGQLEDYLLVSQIGKTAALMGVGILFGRFLSDPNLTRLVTGTDSLIYSPGHFFLVFMVIGVFQLVVGQEVPKHWGVQHSDRCAEALSSFLRLSYILVWPMLWIIKYLSATVAQR